jgi:hypothetical protein
MSYETLLYDTDGPVATITLNRRRGQRSDGYLCPIASHTRRRDSPGFGSFCSCDTVYSGSPAASRASERSR